MKAYRYIGQNEDFPLCSSPNARVFGSFVKFILKSTCQVDSDFYVPSYIFVMCHCLDWGTQI